MLKCCKIAEQLKYCMSFFRLVALILTTIILLVLIAALFQEALSPISISTSTSSSRYDSWLYCSGINFNPTNKKKKGTRCGDHECGYLVMTSFKTTVGLFLWLSFYALKHIRVDIAQWNCNLLSIEIFHQSTIMNVSTL